MFTRFRLKGDDLAVNYINKYVVRRETKEKTNAYHIFYDPVEFYRYKKTMGIKSHVAYHEVITGPCKPFVDVDFLVEEAKARNVDHDALIHNLVKQIRRVYKQRFAINLDLSTDIVLTGGHTADKISYHLVIDNYYHSDISELSVIMKEVLSSPKMSKYTRWIDAGVYTPYHTLRILGETKIDTNRTKRFLENWKYMDNRDIDYIHPREIQSDTHREIMQLLAASITFTKLSTLLPRIYPPKKKQKNEDIPDEMAQEAVDIYKSVAQDPYDASYLSTSGRIVSLRREHKSICITCKHDHDSENPYLLIDALNNVVFHCRRNKDSTGKLTGMGTIIGKIEIQQNPVEQGVVEQGVVEQALEQGVVEQGVVEQALEQALEQGVVEQGVVEQGVVEQALEASPNRSRRLRQMYPSGTPGHFVPFGQAQLSLAKLGEARQDEPLFALEPLSGPNRYEIVCRLQSKKSFKH
jgi:hypothetical protein